ncbi:alpha/beta fold hydrolase [Streptomyces sp. NPDC055107]
MTTTPRPTATAPRPEQPVSVRLVRAASAPRPIRLLLLHGLCSSAAVWDRYLDLAHERYEVWVAELPWRGTGMTGWTDRPVEDWVEEAVSAVPGAPDIVIAHSFGTSSVLSWLDRRSADPARGGRDPRAVVLVSPLYRARADNFDWQSMEYYLNNFVRILTDGMNARGGRHSAKRQQAVALKVRDFIGPYGWIRFFETYLRMPHIRTDRLWMPFLVIGGAEDFVAFPSDAEALGASVPDASVHILPSEHFPMVSSPQLFAQLVNDFIQDLDARPGVTTPA